MIFSPFPAIDIVHRLLDDQDSDPQYERKDLYEHVLVFDWLDADWKHTASAFKQVPIQMGPATHLPRILGYMVRSALELLPHDVGSVMIVRQLSDTGELGAGTTSLGLVYTDTIMVPNNEEAPEWFREARTEPPRPD